MARAARTTGSSNSDKTRRALVSTATRLFAERGLDGVSLAEINRAAGQRNATALHYHFGGRDGLLQAIFDKHAGRVNVMRAGLLKNLPKHADIAAVVPVLIVPLAQQVLDEDGGIYYLQFLAQLMNNPKTAPTELDRHHRVVVQEQQRRFHQALREVPDEIRSLRVNFAVLMTFNALAAYAAEVQRTGYRADRHQLVVGQLVDACIAVLDFPGPAVSE